jgi:hypothetical protein
LIAKKSLSLALMCKCIRIKHLVALSVMSALRRLRQENHEFKASLDNIVRPCLEGRKEGREGGREGRKEIRIALTGSHLRP